MIFFNPDRFLKPVRIDQEIVKNLYSKILNHLIFEKFWCNYKNIKKFSLQSTQSINLQNNQIFGIIKMDKSETLVQ